ncbi:apolipoprotein D and lipocalin family protein [Nitrosomonas aestuarii]|uniref:Outer membrane lipoprotein Blc n=1 Tax=Nitrosomonas aestuarii TaxID=52441 RepID=A0A1I3XTX0_9PROT|nr:lipocalin family protein [Nitrosomonas aestuarii]SFK22511.1 apolipoprotein D and lipocalin family protein [Nitrosomonas aestuarii]
MRISLLLLLIFSLISCTGIPDGVTPVTNFDENRYLGKWYEIARLDHSFERGLSHVTAEYALKNDGGISVINRGFSTEENKWKEAEGKAYFIGTRDEGHLKVSFFGPFYGSYVIFDLDHENYQYAFVSGYNTSYLWLLSRTPTVSQTLRERFIHKSSKLGFDTNALIFTEHN